MATRLTTKDLISQVRSLIDEENQENVDDLLDILPALNRAQDYASNILARHYEAPLLTYVEGSTTSGQAELDIPENAFEQRIEKLEIKINQHFSEILRIDYRDLSSYEGSTTSGKPFYYCVVGDKVRLLGSLGSVEYRLWFLDDPKPLTIEQGRIAVIGSQYVIVDSIGDQISFEQEDLNSFVNWVDGTTGKVKATLQVQSIQTNKVTFKTSADRDSIQGLTVVETLPASGELDDYLCVAPGTCISILKKPFSNFLVQYAVAELSTLKLGGPAEAPAMALQKLEKQVESSWVGREQSLRIKKRNKHWFMPPRRTFAGR